MPRHSVSLRTGRATYTDMKRLGTNMISAMNYDSPNMRLPKLQHRLEDGPRCPGIVPRPYIMNYDGKCGLPVLHLMTLPKLQHQLEARPLSQGRQEGHLSSGGSETPPKFTRLCQPLTASDTPQRAYRGGSDDWARHGDRVPIADVPASAVHPEAEGVRDAPIRRL